MNRVLLVFSACCLLGTVAFADSLGPPTAGLKTKQMSAGAEYFFEETNIEISNSSLYNFFGQKSIKIKELETNRIYIVLGYGLSDVWEVFLRLGSSDAKYEGEFRSIFEFAGGIGTKYTFIQDQTLPWGALLQVSWHSAEDDGVTVGELPFDTITGDVEIKWNEIKIVIGPTYNYSENMRFYGGLGVFLFDGEVEASDGVDKLDVNAEEESDFGGYFGAQYNLDENNVVNVEAQFTSNSWGIGAGIIWKF